MMSLTRLSISEGTNGTLTDDHSGVLNYVDEYNNSYGEVSYLGIDQVVDPDVEYIVWSEGDTVYVPSNMVFQRHALHQVAVHGNQNGQSLGIRSEFTLAQDNDEAGRIATQKLCEVYIVL